jgi:hypothetical protein
MSLVRKKWFTNVAEEVLQKKFNLSDGLEFERCLTNVMYKAEALIKNAETNGDRRCNCINPVYQVSARVCTTSEETTDNKILS